MDPNVALIVGALVGAIANQIPAAVKDTYNGLKSLIQQRFSNNAPIQGALVAIETEPKLWEQPLANALQQAGAGADTEIVAAAQQLQTALQSAGITITVSGNTQSGTGNVQQNIGQVSGGTVIGKQTNAGRKEDD